MATKPVKKAKTAKKEDKKPAKKPVAKAPAKAAKPVKAAKSVKEKTARLPKIVEALVEEAVETQAEAVEVVEVETKVIFEAKPAKVKKEKAPSAKARAAAAALQAHNAEENKKWTDLKEKHGDEKAQPYSMNSQFESHKPLQHKVLGWGYILSNNNDRLEVLFETGTRLLISNYNPGKK